MKLHKSLLLFGASAILLTACGEEGNSDDAEATEEPETEEVTEEPEQVEETSEEENATEESEVAEPEEAEAASNEITLGEPIEFDGFTITVQGYELSTDMDGKDALVIHYDWENTSEETASPFMTFIFKGFQNGVETGDDIFMVEGVDLSVGQSEVRPGGKVEGASDTVAIEDLSVPLELELDELFSFESNARLVELDLSAL